ncbi:unnamed protein product [Arabidopsis thaliana]|uniref:KIB1-4 beta-propeller domain-containing protein n=3 Tax=Arabidopsis TaxID=3701 RepID=Q9LSR0_ARATH|nr:hypothetical protein (DUF295) [Arabidopsis thaliana]KAG7606059.1 hypothetical protein ISN45_At05g050130 [Arabidopsis thaliana x Arabidopsis arenosa]AAX23937.1 hypothetical protein At5g54450 [Arabidopsis thaliana]AED96497.1 hypothetical protein (DUF295) [Arabidopsis thaliana]OAO92052.1 hypothetical protein AXX17_AT5G53530 [Arabidopsis thaliana]BAA97518.1 unnamed protein product [Arabidopsis thaliana]|eukprot:NP_200256.1 hypothetical protein (DUF295) [Arabidopsis thaliana]
MSLLLRRLSKLCLSKPASVRSSLLLSNGFSSSSLLQSPPCNIIGARRCGPYFGTLIIFNANEDDSTYLEKKVPMELVVYNDATVTIGASHGWVATVNKDDGILRLRDDLNPYASYTDPRSIRLPPLVTLPHCQTQIITNVAMSCSSPEDEDCVVAVKFLGPQLSFCRPARSHSDWTNIRIENPCFFSSRVMFSKKYDMFRIPGSGGHIIGSWDLRRHKHDPVLQRLRFRKLPELPKTKRELLDFCCITEHLVESPAGETFLVKWYRKTAPARKTINGMVKMQTKTVMVFKLDEKGNAVYSQDIGDLYIFLSKSEPFCVPASSFPGMSSNRVEILDVNENVVVDLSDYSMTGGNARFGAPYSIPPQKLD